MLCILLSALFLFSSALAASDTERLAQLDMIAQADQRYQTYQYAYQKQAFRESGCLPSSAVNALLALLGTPETNVPDLLLQMLSALRAGDINADVDLAYLHYAMNRPRSSAHELKQLIAPTTSIDFYDCANGIISPRQLLTSHISSDSDHPLLIARCGSETIWHWLAEIAAYLCENGHPDARIALCGASVGTPESNGPLHASQYGHFVAFYMNAEEFHLNNTVYLLDSSPRALAGEPVGEWTPFLSTYPFITEDHATFNRHYTPSRVSNTVIQFNLKEDKLIQLHGLADPSAARINLQQQYASSFKLCGGLYMLLYLP